MASHCLEDALVDICRVFGIEGLNKHQKEAIKYVVETKKDLFVSLPTGCGKSLIYHALPVVFSSMSSSQAEKHIVIVVSPLSSLMKDQVCRLISHGVSATSLNETSSEDSIQAVLSGAFSVVFGSPESWLDNEIWRKMIGNDVYKKSVRAVVVDEAHVISHWYVLYNCYNIVIGQVCSQFLGLYEQ